MAAIYHDDVGVDQNLSKTIHVKYVFRTWLTYSKKDLLDELEVILSYLDYVYERCIEVKTNGA